MMEICGGREYLEVLVRHQLKQFYMWDGEDETLLSKCFDEGLGRTEHSLSYSQLKHNMDSGRVSFSPLHQGQYVQFLYFLANSIWKNEKESRLPQLLIALNKSLHSIDLSYMVDMPPIFFGEHPLACVLGKGTFSDFFFFLQGCTVGTSSSAAPAHFPTIGKYVTMSAHSAILGESKVGDYVSIAMGAVVKDENIESDSIVFGESPNLVIKKRTREESKVFASNLWRSI